MGLSGTVLNWFKSYYKIGTTLCQLVITSQSDQKFHVGFLKDPFLGLFYSTSTCSSSLTLWNITISPTILMQMTHDSTWHCHCMTTVPYVCRISASNKSMSGCARISFSWTQKNWNNCFGPLRKKTKSQCSYWVNYIKINQSGQKSGYSSGLWAKFQQPQKDSCKTAYYQLKNVATIKGFLSKIQRNLFTLLFLAGQTIVMSSSQVLIKISQTVAARPHWHQDSGAHF